MQKEPSLPLGSSPEIEFFVQGEPRPQGSKTPVVRGGRAFLIEGKGKAPAMHKKWRQTVAEAAEKAAGTTTWDPSTDGDGPMWVSLEFNLLRPKSRNSSLKYADRKPDVDNLTRSILDSLTGPILREDSRVVELQASKVYVSDEINQGVAIKIRRIYE